MKIRGLFKKAAATLMAAVTALSILPATTAFAAGDIGTISFSHTYDSSGNAMRYNSSATFDGHTAGGTGNYKYRMFVDGENAFCIQPGVPLKTGNTLKQASSDTWNALSANQKKAVGLALLYGYQGNRSNLIPQIPRPVPESERLSDPCRRRSHYLCKGDFDPHHRLIPHIQRTKDRAYRADHFVGCPICPILTRRWSNV